MIRLKTLVPGPKSARMLSRIKKRNGGWGIPHPLVMSGNGEGAYCDDLDKNRFLDLACQVASNPLGYNHPELVTVVRAFSKRFPVKFAGQDFSIPEHLEMLEELQRISPRELNMAFLSNSGTEAIENAVKICSRTRNQSKLGLSLHGAFHGRTLGALSFTNSKQVHKKGYWTFPALRLPFNDTASEELERIVNQEATPNEIGFVLLECIQGEGGYRFASKEMVKSLRKKTKEYGIPLICDEVQSGMGRTGNWWAFEHYAITPDVFSTAKALQVGATVSSRRLFPREPGAISNTWGGGHALDLAIGIKTIEIIRKQKLLPKNQKTGKWALHQLQQIPRIQNPRGLGLMMAFDLPSHSIRDNVVIECAKNGVLVLGCGNRSIRIVPPFVITQSDLHAGFEVIEQAIARCTKSGFKHTGKICDFMGCSASHT